MFPSSLSHMPITITPCQKEFVRFKRVHRKKRINKKWRNKYGVVTRCKGMFYRVGRNSYACACVVTALVYKIK